jgi:hypothetical protein
MSSTQPSETPTPVAQSAQNVVVDKKNYRLPDATTFSHIIKLAIVEDKPIMMDYWTGSLDKSIIVGVKEDGDKMLLKGEDEYTSPIVKIYKVGNEYIIMTENSIYVVDAKIQTKRISL